MAISVIWLHNQIISKGCWPEEDTSFKRDVYSFSMARCFRSLDKMTKLAINKKIIIQLNLYTRCNKLSEEAEEKCVYLSIYKDWLSLFYSKNIILKPRNVILSWNLMYGEQIFTWLCDSAVTWTCVKSGLTVGQATWSSFSGGSFSNILKAKSTCQL